MSPSPALQVVVSSDQRFAWRGVGQDGVPCRGQMFAVDLDTARARLKKARVWVVDVQARGTAPRPRPGTAEVTRFARQLGSLVRAGLPLAASLELLSQTPSRSARARDMARIAAALQRDIMGGTRFADALARYPAQFGPFFRQLVTVGEASGSLALVLARLADDRERAATQRAAVRAALTYPGVILLLALLITTALLLWVVPTFGRIFEGFGAQLPMPTRFVLTLSTVVARWSIAAGAGGATAAVVTARAMRRSAAVRAAAARLALGLPVIGGLLTTLCVARWSRALGTLLAAGTPLADAFESLRQATGNPCFDQAAGSLAPRVRRGERLASAMTAAGCFPADAIAPIAVAEESGTLDAMLLDVATLADRHVAEQTTMLATLCEPLVIVVLGALVGGLVLAMYLPVIQLGNVV